MGAAGRLGSDGSEWRERLGWWGRMVSREAGGVAGLGLGDRWFGREVERGGATMRPVGVVGAARCIFDVPYAPLQPLIPAEAGIQGGLFPWVGPWVPTLVGKSGTKNKRSHWRENRDPRHGADYDRGCCCLRRQSLPGELSLMTAGNRRGCMQTGGR